MTSRIYPKNLVRNWHIRRIAVCVLIFISATAIAAPETKLDVSIEKCVKILRFGEMYSVDLPTKESAVIALGLIGDNRVIPILSEHYTNESNQSLRLHIVISLGWIGSNAVVPTLETALKDPYYFTRMSAANALKRITGISYQYRASDTPVPVPIDPGPTPPVPFLVQAQDWQAL